ncbi:MAG: hypothetical protein QXW87_01005 [Desulfurococcaceae archaeon]
MRWLYLLTIIIPTLLGMFTTLVTLTLIFPPGVILTPPAPAILEIVDLKINRSGRDIIVFITVRNDGDEGLYIQKIYANEIEVVSRSIYLEPRSTEREISFVLPRRIGSEVEIIVFWKSEKSEEIVESRRTVTIPRS